MQSKKILVGSTTNSEPGIPKDIASEVRRAYVYQSAVGVILICGAIKDGGYKEFWFEHRDDILAVRHDGIVDVYQVKTKSSLSKWSSRDKEVLKAINRFGRLETEYAGGIGKYIFYSNVPPYIPSEISGDDAKRSTSLVVLRDVLLNVSVDALPGIYVDELKRVSASVELPIDTVVRVLQKLEFVKGRGLEEFKDDLTSNLFSLPQLDGLSVSCLRQIAEALLQRVESASTLDLPGLDTLTSVISNEGLPIKLVENKRVTVSQAETIISRFVLKRKHKMRAVFAGLIASAVLLVTATAWVFYKPESQTYLEKSIKVLMSARDASLPPLFAESVSAVRSAKFSLESIDLGAASLRCQDMSNLDLKRMTAASLRGTGVIFSHSNLYMANLTHGELNTGSYVGAIVDHAFFDGSNMLYSNFSDSISRWASFKGTTLTASDFSRADFSQSDFSKSDLSMSDFRHTNLSGANFEGAILTGADLSGSVLIGARGLTQTMLDGACIDKGSLPKLDKNLRPPSKSCYSGQKQKEERVISQQAVGLIGQMVVMEGYCKSGEVVARPPDGHGRSDLEMPFFVPLKPIVN